MILARVVGTVVATRKDPRLEGKTLLVLKPVSPEGKDEAGYVVAVDTSAPATANASSPSPAAPRAWPRAARTFRSIPPSLASSTT